MQQQLAPAVGARCAPTPPFPSEATPSTATPCNARPGALALCELRLDPPNPGDGLILPAPHRMGGETESREKRKPSPGPQCLSPRPLKEASGTIWDTPSLPFSGLLSHLYNGSVRPALQSCWEPCTCRACSVPGTVPGRAWAIREQGPTSLHASHTAPGLKPVKERGGVMQEESPTTKDFDGLPGCVFFCKDKICWVIKHTRTHRLRPGDKESSNRRLSLSLSLSL